MYHGHPVGETNGMVLHKLAVGIGSIRARGFLRSLHMLNLFLSRGGDGGENRSGGSEGEGDGGDGGGGRDGDGGEGGGGGDNEGGEGGGGGGREGEGDGVVAVKHSHCGVAGQVCRHWLYH